MNKSASVSTNVEAGFWARLLFRLWIAALALAALTAGYVCFTGLIYVFELSGAWFELRGLGIVALGIDIALLAGVILLLRHYGDKSTGRSFMSRLESGFLKSLIAQTGAELRRWTHTLAGVLGPLLVLLIVVLVFAAADWYWQDLRGGFWTLRNFRTIGVQTATIAVAALGMTVIIVAGGIDLSVGTALALAATVLAYGLDQGIWIGLPWIGYFSLGSSIWVALAAGVVVGVLTGVLNGSLISLLRVVPFIVTLGTMSAFLGVAKLLAKETTVRPPLGSVPDWLPAMVKPIPDLEWLAWPLLPNFGWGVWLALALAIALACMLHFTVFGRHVFALGSNESTARLCGINVPMTKIAVYAVGGLFVGVAGIFHFARLSTGDPTSGLGMELKVIAAVVIGGGSLNGGRGSVVGTLTGAAIMLVITSGCTALGLRNPIQDIIIGAIIVAAVTIDQFRQRRLASV